MQNKLVLIALISIFIVLPTQMFSSEKDFIQTGTENTRKLSFGTRIFLHKYEMQKNNPERKNLLNDYSFQNRNDVNTAKFYIKINEKFNQTELEKLDAKVLVRTKSIVLVSIPINKIEDLAGFDFVEFIEVSTRPQPMLDHALHSSRVDKVHQGIELARSYFGEGVIVGIGDIGFDFTHPMFSDKDGNSRVKRAWIPHESGTPPAGMTTGHLYTDSSEIKYVLQYSKEEVVPGCGRTGIHGTHVLGIAAGTSVEAEKSTYSGVATGSDIVVVELVGVSVDITPLEATVYMFRYADSVGKPIVINYSISYRPNAHAGDGESLFDIAMSELIQENPEGKIVIAGAGNEGDSKAFAKVDLESNDSAFIIIPFSTHIHNVGLPAQLLAVYFWGEPDNPFTVDLYYKNGAQKIKYRTFNTNNPVHVQQQQIQVASSIYVMVDGQASSTSPFYLDNKPNVAFILADITPYESPDSCYIVVKGSNTNIFMWAHFTEFSSIMSNHFVVDGSYTIGSPASVEEVIAVGAYVTRITEDEDDYDGDLDDIANFSSKGPLTNGRIKPDITAPGAQIYSALHGLYGHLDYVDKTPDGNYKFFGASGTSMSAPMVTGIVALMLEINPKLTVNEIKDIIRITAINDEWTGDAKNNKSTVWGWGKIDAHAIMKYLETNSIEEFENTISFTAYPNPVVNNEITISISDTVCDLPFVVNIYDASGRLVFLSSMQDVKTFDISRLDSGFYFIKLDNGRYSAVQKIVVGR